MGPVSDIVVEAVGEGPEKYHCESFRPTPSQVRNFLQHAVLITWAQKHDSFDDGPCSARGTLATRYGTWHWVLHNMGTGELHSDSDGEVTLLADPRQESWLDETQHP
jgi:hypothetical protein